MLNAAETAGVAESDSSVVAVAVLYSAMGDRRRRWIWKRGAFAARRDEMTRKAGRSPLATAADRKSYGLFRPCTNGPLARYRH